MNDNLLGKAGQALGFARACFAGRGSWLNARDFADATYHRHFIGELINKTISGPMTLADLDDAVAPSYSALMELVAAESIVGRLANLRRVPVATRYLKFVSGSTGYWVGEAKPRPFSTITLDGDTLSPLSVNAMILQTKELVLASGKVAQDAFNRDLVRALAAALDEAFIDPNNTGTPGVMPASITSGAVTVAASGSTLADLAYDVGLLIQAFGGDLQSATFVTDARTAANMALLGSIATIDVGARGGTLLGIPLITTRSSARDSNGGQLALIDGAGIAYADDIPQFNTSEVATVQVSDTPTDPVVANTVMTSLWQHNLLALRVTQVANWRAERDGAVAVLTGMFPG